MSRFMQYRYPKLPTHCPHGVLLVPSCSGHGRFLCSVGYGHVCLPDPCKECGADE